MTQKLPDIAIRTDVAPAEFIRRIETLDLKGYTFDRQGRWNESSGNLCLNVYPPHKTRQEGSRGQLACSTRSTVSTAVEAYARWSNGDRPTYATYVATAKQIFQPLLRAYRSRFGGRCQMRVESKQALRPKLPKRAQYFFDRFADAANPLNWDDSAFQPFYEFIRAAYGRHVRISRDDLIWLLAQRGFRKVKARYLADFYIRGCELLSCRAIRNVRSDDEE